MGGEDHHQAHPVSVLKGSQQRSAEKVNPGFTRAHSHTAFGSYSGGEERKGAFAVQTGLRFTGKGRRFLREPLQEACVSDSVSYCRKVWKAAGLHSQRSHSSDVWQLLHPLTRSLLVNTLNGPEQSHLGLPTPANGSI